jgi:hypothetical protein
LKKTIIISKPENRVSYTFVHAEILSALLKAKNDGKTKGLANVQIYNEAWPKIDHIQRKEASPKTEKKKTLKSESFKTTTLNRRLNELIEAKIVAKTEEVRPHYYIDNEDKARAIVFGSTDDLKEPLVNFLEAGPKSPSLMKVIETFNILSERMLVPFWFKIIECSGKHNESDFKEYREAGIHFFSSFFAMVSDIVFESNVYKAEAAKFIELLPALKEANKNTITDQADSQVSDSFFHRPKDKENLRHWLTLQGNLIKQFQEATDEGQEKYTKSSLNKKDLFTENLVNQLVDQDRFDILLILMLSERNELEAKGLDTSDADKKINDTIKELTEAGRYDVLLKFIIQKRDALKLRGMDTTDEDEAIKEIKALMQSESWQNNPEK